MICHFMAYWVIGLPLGAWLCFGRNWGGFGIWSGLSLALILIGIVLLFAWRHTVRCLSQAAPIVPARKANKQASAEMKKAEGNS